MKIGKNLLSIGVVVSVLVFGVGSDPLKASAIGPFGGAITSIFTCVNGLKIGLTPPTPGFYMYVPGSFSFLFGPPSHPGQWLLGMSGPPIICFVPCEAGLCPFGGGGLIIYHGSSI